MPSNSNPNHNSHISNLYNNHHQVKPHAQLLNYQTSKYLASAIVDISSDSHNAVSELSTVLSDNETCSDSRCIPP